MLESKINDWTVSFKFEILYILCIVNFVRHCKSLISVQLLCLFVIVTLSLCKLLDSFFK